MYNLSNLLFVEHRSTCTRIFGILLLRGNHIESQPRRNHCECHSSMLCSSRIIDAATRLLLSALIDPRVANFPSSKKTRRRPEEDRFFNESRIFANACLFGLLENLNEVGIVELPNPWTSWAKELPDLKTFLESFRKKSDQTMLLERQVQFAFFTDALVDVILKSSLSLERFLCIGVEPMQRAHCEPSDLPFVGVKTGFKFALYSSICTRLWRFVYRIHWILSRVWISD